MKLEPIARHREALYPTRDEVDANPDVLRRIPARWRGQAVVLTALAATTSLLALSASAARADDKPDGPVARVAPIFPHGEGRAWFGGPAGPALCYDEANARQVITEELKAAGLTVKPDALTVADAAIPVTSYNDPIKDTKAGPLVLDLVDTEKHIAVEFISSEDIDAWSSEELDWIRGGTYETKATAQLLRDGLAAKAPAGAYAVFYEPTAVGRKDDETARLDLRLQVRDFVAWLKVQGVI